LTRAQGNKVRKTLLNSNNEQINTTYYVYDALGTLLAIYKKEGRYGQISLIEAPINAPGRIGMWRFGQGEKLHDNYPLPLNPLYTRTVNKKLYELTDQTGNVRVVITDRKRVNGSDEAKPDIAMSAQYYPYGMAQAGRVASAGADYRYGYNGMEEEDRGDAVSSEIASTGEKAKPGEANLLNTEFRLYDPRLGQWLTRDPVFQPWESPYSAMAGNPILFSDPQGDCVDCTHKTTKGDTYTSLAEKYNTTVEQLRIWNKYEDNKIPIGVDLIISNPNIIAKSEKVPGVGDDMGSGNNTLKEVKNRIGRRAIYVERNSWSDEKLEGNMSSLGRSFADSERDRTMVQGVFNHFYESSGTPYSNPLLTESATNHLSTQRFINNEILPSFHRQIQSNQGYDPVKMNLKLKGNPRFNEVSERWGIPFVGHGDEDNGLMITINDVHAYQVEVLDYKQDGNNYTANLELTLYDHFGLDDRDINEHPYSTLYPQFYSWYMLQWQRGYKPFITYMKIQFNTRGSILRKK
jgi:RHS repeat-associated protein